MGIPPAPNAGAAAAEEEVAEPHDCEEEEKDAVGKEARSRSGC